MLQNLLLSYWIYQHQVSYSLNGCFWERRKPNSLSEQLLNFLENENMNLRCITKRYLKWAVEYASQLSGAAALYRTTAYYRGAFRILTYHKITDAPKTTHDLTKKHFSEHVKILANEFHVVRLPELVRRLTEDRAPEPGSVAITFDDGYSEISDYVAETLDKYRLTATFFIVTGYVDGTTKGHRGPYVSWDDLRSMNRSGFSIGSHSVSHVSMKDLAHSELQYELVHSFERIHSETGAIPCGFSYPYGTKRDFSAITRQEVITGGYPWAVTAIHGLNPLGIDHFSLKRINITSGDGPKTLRLIMKGCLDAWGLLDQVAYRFQRVNYRS